MAFLEKAKKLLRDKKREFTSKRGRMSRSRFFVNLCLVYTFIFVYILALFGIVNAMDRAAVSHIIYSNMYYVGVGILFLLLAFATRPVRLKRLRDMGLPAQVDLPFMILLILNGFGPIFHFFEVPYLQSLEVISMPGELRDFLVVFWLLWMLVLILGPSKHRQDIFTNPADFDFKNESPASEPQ